MELKQFQMAAVSSLFEAMGKPSRDIVLKSPTGSGKTIILTYFMHQYTQSYPKTVFVWLTPGKGNLEEQSKAKMDKYIHAAQTKLLADVMTAGFEENDHCFINWEKLTKKGNNALKDSERTNFIEHIEHALNDGLRFVVIVDESHQNNTVKADEIIQYFHTDKIIRCSATPKGIKNAEIIEIPEEDVIAEGLIKKMLIINENFPQAIETSDQNSYLLEKALEKQHALRSALLSAGKDINPLIVVQIPNKSEKMQDDIERYFDTQGITYENQQLAAWLSNMHENLEGIDEPNAKPIAVIIKQAVATGWDCPRAYILVKLRDNMDETFEIQTIGRIRRMPEAHHYGNDLLDSCYLIPQSCLFTYDGTAKTQLEMKKNVYRGYLSSAEVRSSSERKFEKYCEHADSVDWVYKNGDKGNEYLSIVYADNSEKQKNFYPDYIISVRGKIWIIETKGGFDRSGNSQDIDIYTPKKFTVLKDYLERYELKGGIVRYDDKSEELCICTENYSDDISSDSWKLLSEVLD